MKKLIVILVILCLIFTCGITYLTWDRDKTENVPAAAEETTPSAETTPAAEETAAAFQAGTVNVEALYASHRPEEVVLTVNGEPVTWEEYFGWLNLQIQQNANTLDTMNAYYGMGMDWSDPVSEDGDSVAKYTVAAAAETIRQNYAVAEFCKSNGAELTDEVRALIETQQQADITNVCGAGATKDDFDAYLESIHMSRSAYDKLTETSALYQQAFKEKYGENGELVADEQALGYMTDNSYLHTNHILLATMDTTTGEALDEATKAEKLAAAQKLYDELKDIKDTEELLKKFNELKAENCEDPGKTVYPEGMTFAAGTMVEPFETAAQAMAEYGVSEPVESEYGYFVIIRLPMNADETIYSSTDTTAMNARMKFADEEFTKLLEDYLATVELKYEPDFAELSIMPFVEHNAEG